VSLQKLLAVVHSSCGMYRKVFGREKEMTDKGLTPVILGSQYTFSPQLFDRAALDFPMRQYSWLTGVGVTSRDIYLVLETEDSQRTVLLSGVTRGVCMDFARGISVPFPDAEKHRLSSALPPEARCFPYIKVPESVPVESFSTTVKVRYEDVDFNQHSSHTKYTTFALECAALASATGYFSRIRGDIAFYRPLSLTCIHLGESFAGDNLNVSTWEAVDNAMLLRFLIKRQQQRTCYIQIEFDGNTIASKL